MTTLIDSHADLLDGGSVIHRRQDIPDDFLSELGDIRLADAGTRAPDALLVARVPVALAETWARQGFDVFRESASAICARLRAESLQAFLATNRSI
jgi:hypothetical protein